MQDNYVTIMQSVKVIGKPCKGKLYARFDEGSLRRLLQIRDLLYVSRVIFCKQTGHLPFCVFHITRKF